MRVLCWVHDQAFERERLRGAIQLYNKIILMLQKHSVQFEERLDDFGAVKKMNSACLCPICVVTQAHPYLICPGNF